MKSKRIVTVGASCFAFLIFALFSLFDRAEAAVCEAEPTDMSVTYGERITCEINPGTDTDLYRFSGKTGDRILAEAVWVSGSGFSPRIKLIAPDGKQLADNGNGTPPQVNIVLPQTGTYTAIISDVGSGSFHIGEYAFTVSCTGGSCLPSPPPEPAGRNIVCEPEPTDMFLQYGTRVTCDITPGTDTDLYRFSGKTGDRILAEAVWVSGSNFYPRIKLIAPDGTQLADNGNGTPPQVNIVLSQTGTYTAIISDVGSGSFHIGEYAFTVSCIGGSCLPTGSSENAAATLSSDLSLHIPLLNFQTQSGLMPLWADFAYVPDKSGDILFKVVKYGQVQ